MRRIVTAAAVLAGLLACGPRVREPPWTIRFRTPELRRAAAVVEATIRDGSCDGAELYRTTFAPGLEPPMGERLPALRAGRYAFSVRARNAACEWYAAACDVLQLPAAGRQPIESMLDALATPDRDPGCTPIPALRTPPNGTGTGSPHADEALLDPDGRLPLRPRFSWEEVAGATSYELQLSSRCESVRSCDPSGGEESRRMLETVLTLPLAVSTDRPVGRRYYWRVRACREVEGGTDCSAFSPIRYTDVGRQAADLDGDGYADLVMGLPMGGAGAGEVRVAYGSAAGPVSPPRTILAHPEPQAGARFGAALATGDIDGDGFGDVVVGAPTHDATGAGSGIAYVFLGGPSGLGALPAATLTPDAGAGALFGHALALLDVDGDGHAEVAVGAPDDDGEGTAAGAVLVFAGGEGGVSPAAVRVVDTDPIDGGRFGSSLSGIDVDGDGCSDLVIGAPGAGRGVALDRAGRFVIVPGSLAGLALDRQLGVDPPEPQAGAQLGAAVGGVGDVDGDAFAEVAAGAPGFMPAAGRTNAGRAYVLAGTATGLDPARRVTLDPPSSVDATFGQVLAAAGDVDADGLADVAFGAPGFDAGVPDEGAVFLFAGVRDTGIATMQTRTLDDPAAAAEAMAARFGAAVAGPGDVDGDGYDDLAVGAPGEAMGAGAVHVYRGAPPLAGSLDIMPAWSFRGDGLGASLAAPGR